MTLELPVSPSYYSFERSGSVRERRKRSIVIAILTTANAADVVSVWTYYYNLFTYEYVNIHNSSTCFPHFDTTCGIIYYVPFAPLTDSMQLSPS